jgi:type I restriction enzyme S subunit
MNRIDKLLEEMCPEGVKFLKLESLCKIETGSRNAGEGVENGKYKFFTTSRSDSKIDTYRWNTEALLIAGNANVGNVKHFSGKFDAYQRTYVLTDFPDFIDVKFLFYLLSTSLNRYLDAKKNVSAMTYIVVGTLKSFLVAIPPLEIQKEIVKTLDKFTELEAEIEAELEAELEAREKQYEEVRRRLLDFESDTSNHPLGEMIREMCPEGIKASSLGANCDFVRGSTLDKKDLREYGLPVVHYGEIHTKYGYKSIESISFVEPQKAAKMRKANPGDLVLVTTSEDVEAVAKPMVWLGVEDLNVGGESYIIRSEIDSLFLAHFFMSPQFKKASLRYISGTKVKRISSSNLSKIQIPVPPLEIQKEIVRILDNLYSLVNSVNEGIPAEIAARRKQYEYYRDKLLTFKELDAA